MKIAASGKSLFNDTLGPVVVFGGLQCDCASVCAGLGQGGEITPCLALTQGIKKNPAGDDDLLSL